MSTELISTKEIKNELRKINRPLYTDWVWYVYPQGYLDLLIESFMKASAIKTAIESISFLSHILTDDMLKSDKKVYYGDLSRTASCNQQAKKLKEQLIGEKIDSKISDKTQRFGTIGHSAVPALFSGELQIEPPEKTGDTGERQMQGSLFSNDFDYELLERLPENPEKKDIKRKKLTWKLMEKIEKNWLVLVREMQKSHSPIQSSHYQALCRDLRFVYKSHMGKVVNTENLGFEDEYLYFLTFMTWAAAVSYYRKQRGSTPLFREVSVLKNSSDVAVGRIDALSVLKINGRNPSRKQLQRIRYMSKHDFTSIGHIIKALIHAFGAHVELKISDWKFAIGDGPKSMKKKLNIVRKDDVAKDPLPEHEQQLKRYLSTTVLSHSLAAGFAKLDDVEKLWEADSFSLTGELVYLFPDTLPVIHQVILTEEEVKEAFKEQIVQSFFPGKRRASLRIASNFAMKYATGLLEGKEGGVKNDEISNTQLSFGHDDPENRKTFIENISMGSIVRQYHVREYLDDLKTIEVVERRGKREYLEMDLAEIYKGFASGSIIKAPGFNDLTGGKIRCPLHVDNTPSCSLAYDMNKFYCFSCGRTGRFNLDTLPDGVEISIGKSTKWELESLVIPERHREIMKVAQIILHRCFWGSRAETYLYFERGLNPWCSYSIMGAGFADERLIMGLMMAGFTFDELVYYGFLGFSPGVSPNSTTVCILKRAGYTIEMQRRLLDPKTNSWGLPYSILENCLTYPLEIHNVVNSFCGRSVIENCAKHLRHKKLRTKENKMRHGGVMITPASESEGEYIMVVEAPLNMATLFETSTDLKRLTGIIGVNNPLLVEILSKYKKNLITGFDWDPLKWNEKKLKWEGETGQRNTVKFRDKLLEYGFGGKAWDFTGGLVKNNPGINYNDSNQYWQDYGRPVSILDNLIEIPERFVEPEERGVKIPE